MSPSIYIPPAPGEAYEWPVDPTAEERFWAKVDRGEASDCWEWTAAKNQNGYGMLRNNGHSALASRLSWVLEHNQPVPHGLHILHTCDNRGCVNPSHLYVGTNADNVRDKVQRGRTPKEQPKKKGEGHPLAKLTEAQVRDIRHRHSGRRGDGRDLAREFGVARSTITLIVQRKLWSHV